MREVYSRRGAREQYILHEDYHYSIVTITTLLPKGAYHSVTLAQAPVSGPLQYPSSIETLSCFASYTLQYPSSIEPLSCFAPSPIPFTLLQIDDTTQ